METLPLTVGSTKFPSRVAPPLRAAARAEPARARARAEEPLARDRRHPPRAALKRSWSAARAGPRAPPELASRLERRAMPALGGPPVPPVKPVKPVQPAQPPTTTRSLLS